MALIVVDIQDCFIDTLANKDEFLRRCAFAIDAAQTLGIETIFTEQVPDKIGSTNTLLKQRAHNAKVFSKKSFSALAAPGIESYLRDHEIYHVLVCGLETPICIYQTALQSIDEDIDATFLTDALGCRRTEDGRQAIAAIRQLDCQTLPSETVFYSLLGSATHPNFRSFSKLVATYSNSRISTQKILSEKPDTARIRSQSSSSGTSKGSGKKHEGPKSKACESKKASSTLKKKLAKKRTSQSGKRKEAPSGRNSAKKKPAKKKLGEKQGSRKVAKVKTHG
tara:strand:+ start:1862 stop:2701 length:840 start_codon:yes stop_codon:yes gene_type:complete